MFNRFANLLISFNNALWLSVWQSPHGRDVTPFDASLVTDASVKFHPDGMTDAETGNLNLGIRLSYCLV